MKKTYNYETADIEAIKILEGFLPDRIFDSHAHLFDSSFLPGSFPDCEERIVFDLEHYKRNMFQMLGNPKEFRMNMITFPNGAMADKTTGCLKAADEFLVNELNKESGNVGEIMVIPTESAEDIEKRLVHPGIKGLKCYYMNSSQPNQFQLAPQEYLPESAWEVANKHKMCITIHLVKNEALAAPENWKYICEMAKKYPDAVLILAHCARSFAAWTAIEAVEKVAHLDNVWYDFSAVCESPAMLWIIKKAGLEKCMWGSDYYMSMLRSKPISIADTFKWVDEKSMPKTWFVGIENLMAVRQACILAELSENEIEDLFYNNAARLWD